MQLFIYINWLRRIVRLARSFISLETGQLQLRKSAVTIKINNPVKPVRSVIEREKENGANYFLTCERVRVRVEN